MYIGNNEFIHAANYGLGVRQDPLENGGWVVALHHPSNTPKSSSSSSSSSGSSSSGSSDFGQKIVDFAKSKLGKSYVWGAEGPDAYDCSGLTQAAYASVGVSIPHQSELQRDDPQFDQVSLDKAMPGDILWTNGHVGIYIGGNEYIDAANESIGIRQTSFQNWNPWSTALHYKNYGETSGGISPNFTGEVDTSKSGDGYPGTYTSTTGFEYKDYKQGGGSWSGQHYWSGTVSSDGCGPASIAILASGLNPKLNKNPGDACAIVTEKYGDISTDDAMIKLMEEFGMKCEYDPNPPTAQHLQEMLRQGKVMMLLGRKNQGSIFPCGTGHFFAAVDIDKDGKIFVMNPNNKADANTGWYDAETVAKGTIRVWATDSGKVANFSESSSDDNDDDDSDAPSGIGYEAIVASWKEIRKTTEYDNTPEGRALAESLGLNIENDTVYSITTSTVNYEDLVQPYTLSFDLLWSYLVIGQSKGFIMDWADLAYDAEIEVSIFDNLTTTTDIDDWSYKLVESCDVEGTVSYEDSKNDIRAHRSVKHSHYYSDNEELQTLESGTKKTKVTIENTLTQALTKAHTWIADYDAKYTYNRSNGTDVKGTKTKDDEEWEGWSLRSKAADTCGEIEKKIDEIVKEVNEAYEKKASQVQSTVTSASDVKQYEKKQITAENVDTSHVRIRTKSDLVDIVDNTTTNTSRVTYTKLTPTFKINDEKHPKPESESSSGSTNRVDTPLNPKITEHHADLSSGSFDYYLYEARPEGSGQPLMLSLHGSGENGGGLGALQYGGSLARFILSGEKQPDCIVIMPSNGDPHGGYGAWNTTALKELVDKVAAETNADTSHLSITGVSRGGYDTWEMLAKYPTMFEAAAPIASDGWQDGLKECKSRVLALSGSADTSNFCYRGVDLVISGGGSAEHKVVAGAGHSTMCNIYGDSAYDPVPFLLETANTPTSAETSSSSETATSTITNLDNFLFIGDSRYDGVEEINTIGSNIKNLGVGAARIDEWVTVAQSGGVGVIQPTTKFRRDVDITGNYAGISIQLGANSLWMGADKAASQMNDLINALKSLHPNTPIFVNSCLPDETYSSEEISSFNNKVNGYCTGGNVFYIDISDGLIDSRGYIKREYTFDGCHLGSSEANRIFADNIKNGILGSNATTNFDEPNGDIVELATRLWKEHVWHSGKVYAAAANGIPITGNSIDCSSWCSWILYEYGYEDFGGPQHVTQQFLLTNWNEKYGWYEIPLEGGQNPINELQPGDMIVRDPGNNMGHITFVVRIEGDRILCYDCGAQSNWEYESQDGEPIDKSYMLTDSRTGKVIRVPSKNSSKKSKIRENFVSLFIKKKYSENKNNILSATDWLFEILESNNKTKNLVDTMKYLLYKATGTDYGVTDVNEIIDLFYPSDEAFTSVNGSGSGSSSSNLVGGSIQEKTWWALRDAGFSPEAAAGVMGNITGESDWDPGGLEVGFDGHQYTYEEIMSNPSKGLGLVGWTWQPYKEALIAFAEHRGKPWYDEDIQIEYLVAELTKDPNDADGYAEYAPFDNSAWNCTVSGWENAATPEDAAYQFCWVFERPYRWDSRRQTWAREFYDQFKDQKRPASSPSSSSSSASTVTDAQAAKVIQRARSWLGKPYVLGAQGPDYVDCSGLVNYAYTGIIGTHGPDTGEMSSSWPEIPWEDAKPGDIAVTRGKGHVILIIENLDLIEADGTQVSIYRKLSDLDRGTYKTIRAPDGYFKE